MREDQLIAMCAARGVDFQYVAGSSNNLKGEAAQTRRLTKAERLAADKSGGIPFVTKSVTGDQTRVYKKPARSEDDLGLAAENMGDPPWLAVRFTVGGDDSGYWELHRLLAKQASRLAVKEKWPGLVRDIGGIACYYQERLAELVLTEERSRWVFIAAAPSPVHAWVMNVPEPTWHQILRPKYTLLQEIYEGWWCAGRALVRRRIMGGLWGKADREDRE